ncbi:hypothetical protein T4A_440 [Trichinella pseudospiralis]|uniref:Uncharacterized protein n=1 Tax=Trichinella pseudospiralis TaxID=6337 RepID=A0A0V1EJ90_TRIPS|nr:hypothetical protein T4A_440 [Trichinella pseudospiralis]
MKIWDSDVETSIVALGKNYRADVLLVGKKWNDQIRFNNETCFLPANRILALKILPREIKPLRPFRPFTFIAFISLTNSRPSMHFLSLRAPLLKRQTTVSMPCLQLMIDGSQQMMSSTLICFPPHHSDHWRAVFSAMSLNEADKAKIVCVIQ